MPVFLPGESQGRGEPGGLPSMGSHRARTQLKRLSSSSSSEYSKKETETREYNKKETDSQI